MTIRKLRTSVPRLSILLSGISLCPRRPIFFPFDRSAGRTTVSFPLSVKRSALADIASRELASYLVPFTFIFRLLSQVYAVNPARPNGLNIRRSCGCFLFSGSAILYRCSDGKSTGSSVFDRWLVDRSIRQIRRCYVTFKKHKRICITSARISYALSRQHDRKRSFCLPYAQTKFSSLSNFFVARMVQPELCRTMTPAHRRD